MYFSLKTYNFLFLNYRDLNLRTKSRMNHISYIKERKNNKFWFQIIEDKNLIIHCKLQDKKEHL